MENFIGRFAALVDSAVRDEPKGETYENTKYTKFLSMYGNQGYNDSSIYTKYRLGEEMLRWRTFFARNPLSAAQEKAHVWLATHRTFLCRRRKKCAGPNSPKPVFAVGDPFWGQGVFSRQATTFLRLFGNLFINFVKFFAGVFLAVFSPISCRISFLLLGN